MGSRVAVGAGEETLCLLSGRWVPEGTSAQKGSLANKPEKVGEATPSQHQADPVGGSRDRPPPHLQSLFFLLRSPLFLEKEPQGTADPSAVRLQTSNGVIKDEVDSGSSW